MEDSVTYQMIVRKGRVREARELLLRLGGKKFGPPDSETLVSLEQLADLALLETLLERILDVSDWQELLSGNPS